MPLTWRQRLAFRISHRYKVRRSIFTLAIPATVAFAICVYFIYTGWAPLPFIHGTSLTTTAPATAANSRLAAFEALIASQDANSTGSSNSTNSTATAPVKPPTPKAPPNPHNIDFLIVGTAVLGLGPYSADITFRGRKERKYEQDFTDFLFELSELVRGGIDPIKAITTLSQGSLGSITKPVQMVAKQMQIGYTFEQSMRNLAVTLKSPLIERYVDLVIQASYSGGTVATLIQRASADMSTFLTIEKEKRAGLSQYAIILYAAQVILIALSAILVVQFLPDLKSIASIGSTSLGGSILGNSDIGSVAVERDLWFLVLINGFMGGLVIGKISEGTIKHGLKHALILMVIGLVCWTVFVDPATSGTAATYDIKIVSYQSQGLSGLPETAPLVVNVTTSAGQPGDTVLVTFTVVGGNGAKLVPTSTDTNGNGQATTTVWLGTSPGIYTVTATVGANQTSVNIQATGSGAAGG
jgi:flagellar protein FlaJ